MTSQNVLDELRELEAALGLDAGTPLGQAIDNEATARATADAVLTLSIPIDGGTPNGFDDTSSLAAKVGTIDPVIGGSLRLRRGTYTITTLNLPDNVRLEGDKGATIVRKAGSTGALVTGMTAMTNVTITGIEFDNAGSTDKILLFPMGSADITVTECLFDTYVSGRAIEFAATTALNSRCRVERNSFVGDGTGSNVSCILAVNPDQLRVSWNQFDGSGAVSIATSSSAAQRSYDVRVEGNDFRNIDASGILVRPNGDTTIQRVRVINNSGVSMGKTLGKGLVVVGEHVGSGTGLTYDVVIAGNTLRDYGSDAGGNGGNFITCGGVGGLVENATISNNVCDARQTDGTVRTGLLNSGIQVRTTTGVTVTGNRTRYTGRGGIRINGCKDFTVTGNSVDHATQSTGYAGVANEHGISMFVDTAIVCSNGIISGNVIRNTGLAADGCCGIGSDRDLHDHITITGNRAYDDRTPKYQAYGIQIGAGGPDVNQPTNWTITNNDLAGNLSGEVNSFYTSPHGHRIDLKPGANRAELVTAARGIVTETVPVGTLQSFTAIDVTAATATGHGYIAGFKAGDTVTGVAFVVSTPTALTALTVTKVALVTTAGVVLAASADQSSDTAAGTKQWTFTSPYLFAGDQACYLLFFSTGTSGSWNVWRGVTGTGAAPSASIHSGSRASVKTGVISDLAVSDTLTLSADGPGWWLAAY